ncbi:MAG TPA: hypothetical protein VIM53_02625 [Candidatus Saccharimonadales bacterium]
MIEKGKDSSRSPRGRRTLLALGASGALGAVLATGACTQTGYDTGTDSFFINCSSGSKPYASYVFINQDPSNKGEFSFNLDETNASGTIALNVKDGEYSVNDGAYSSYKAGAAIHDVGEHRAEVYAGELVNTSHGQVWKDPTTSFTLVCASQPFSQDTPGTVHWQDIPQ